MATKRADNDNERFARIEALMEEYRIKHEDLEAYVQATRDRMIADRNRSRQQIRTLRATFRGSKSR